MRAASPAIMPDWLNDQAIEEQLERIYLHPDFSSSRILRRFLSFIVQETLTGNAVYLKEYTIALKVLEKPNNFNPQKNCIVRIHASRLRKALCHYYNQPGQEDRIFIGVPKGKYVPIFMDRKQWFDESVADRGGYDLYPMANFPRLPIFAIMPFHFNSDNREVSLFIDNLCLQICSGLAQVKDVSVVSYLMVKSMAARSQDLQKMSAMLHFNHIVTVGVQYLKERSRINVQIVDCKCYQPIWSRIFDCQLDDIHLFDVQDTICQEISERASSLVAVA